MKLHLSLLFLVISFSIFAQEVDLEENIQSLKVKIQQSEKGEKLKWMDSLSNVIAFDTSFESDSLVVETRKYAFQLDSFDIAIQQTANLIYFYNALNGNANKAKKLFLSNQQYLPYVTNNNIKCKFFYDAANVYFNLNEYQKSLSLYDSVMFWAEKENSYKFKGRAILGKGQVYTDTGAFGEASLTLQEAIHYFQKEKDTSQVIETRNSLTILYSKNGFFKEAKKERDEIIKLSLARKEYKFVPVFYFNEAADDNKMGNQEKRISNLLKALEYVPLTRYQDYFEPIILSVIIVAYAENDSIALAEKHLEKLNSLENHNTGGNKTYYLDAIKSVAFAKHDYKNAILYGEEYLSLMREKNQYEEIGSGEQFLSKVYQAIGNKDLAFQHYKNYTILKDSIENNQKVRVLSYYQTLYETEKKDLKIKAQESNIALLDSENKVKNQWLLFGGIGLISIFGFVVLIRSRNTAKKRQLDQKKFTEQIVNTQEVERSRVAHELHDSVGQKLLILKNSLFLKENKQTDESSLLDETIKEVREMSHSLHPFQFEKVGLVTSLEDMVSTFQKSSDIFYSSEIEDISGMIPKEKEIFIFRMLQECISNVEKHSGATGCNLSVMQKNNHVIFQLKDNGKGFDVSLEKEKNKSLGMKTLEERARFIEADFSITSEVEKGTQVSIKIDKI